MNSCSVRVPSLLIWWRHINFIPVCATMLCRFGTTPYSFIFNPIAALLQAVLQANTEPFRSSLLETRNRTVKTSKNHIAGPKWSKMMMKWFWAWNMNFCTTLYNQTKYYYFSFPVLEKCLIFCPYYYLLCRRGNKHFDVHFWWIGLVFFPSKNGKDVAYEGRNGWKGVYFARESESFVFVVNMIRVLFIICTSTRRVNNNVSRQREGINRRNESTIPFFIKISDCTVQQRLRTFKID